MKFGTQRKKKPAACACATDHTQASWQATHDALKQIIDGSIEAQRATEYKGALEAWGKAIAPGAKMLGAATLPDLPVRLRARAAEEAKHQHEAYERADTKAGDAHGSRRGMYEAAEKEVSRALELLGRLKAHHHTLERATRKAAKVTAKAAKKPLDDREIEKAANAAGAPIRAAMAAPKTKHKAAPKKAAKSKARAAPKAKRASLADLTAFAKSATPDVLADNIALLQTGISTATRQKRDELVTVLSRELAVLTAERDSRTAAA